MEKFVVVIFFLTQVHSGNGQTLNLKELLEKDHLDFVNRIAQAVSEQSIRIPAYPDNGLVWIHGIDFSEGIIEFELNITESLAGIAYHGQNDHTYEAVYFNFYQSKKEQKHTVQYISHPRHTWSYLHKNKPGLFEKTIENLPAPGNWLPVKLEIRKEGVKIFKNQNTHTLAVPSLSDCSCGKLGLYLGENFGGSFRNILIQPNQK
jgi:hypothetical protein